MYEESVLAVTALLVGAGDTIRVRIEMTRLALDLPTVVVRGAWTKSDAIRASGQPHAMGLLRLS